MPEMRFVGRRRELEALQSAYETPSFQFLAVYGRRRVGKTFLLAEFARDKRNVFFFTGSKTTERGNLVALSRAISDQLVYRAGEPQPAAMGDLEPGDELRGQPLAASTFASLPDAIEAIFQLASRLDRSLGRPVVIIDEYPYLAQSDPGIQSTLQQIIDRTKATSDVMLVLCGSSMSFMERQVLGEESPLYGRRTGQIKLVPMDVFESAEVLGAVGESLGGPGEVGSQLAIEAYGVAGGVPLYLEQLDPRRTLEWNLAERLFRQTAFLYLEPTNYLLQEVRSPESYNAIIASVASGRTSHREIADDSGVKGNSITPYLKRLEELGIIRRWEPVPSRFGGRAAYRIADPLFGFWYGISGRYVDAIEARLGERLAQRILRREFPTYMGLVFEDVCRQWVRRQMAEGRIDAIPKAVGKWWGTDPVRREQSDIDVAVTTHEGLLVLGECRWRNEPMDRSVLETLESRAATFPEREKLLLAFRSPASPRGPRTTPRRARTCGC